MDSVKMEFASDRSIQNKFSTLPPLSCSSLPMMPVAAQHDHTDIAIRDQPLEYKRYCVRYVLFRLGALIVHTKFVH